MAVVSSASYEAPTAFASSGKQDGWYDYPSVQQKVHSAHAEELEELRRQNQRLRVELEVQREWSDWWWVEYQRLEKLLEREASAWQACRITSPLNKVEQWCDSMTNEGWTWHHWEHFCPCCKKPLDVTVMRNDRPPSTASAGSKLRCTKLPVRSDKTPIFLSPRCYTHIGYLNVGDVISAIGAPEVVDGYTMVPVYPRGAVDMRLFELVRDERCATLPMSMQSRGAKDAGAGRSGRHAYCAAIWGANGGYALGAAVLGARLRELSEDPVPDRVLLHTDDVPSNFLQVLSDSWILRQVDYIDGVEELYSTKGTAFDGVFTKLAAWALTDYDKVLLLDIDLAILKSPVSLFDLDPPAALIRGNGSLPHGSPVNGRRFFCGEEDRPWSWAQGGGINAGVILLRPCAKTFAQMVAEVTSQEHPEHIHGNGPEQDYLTRFFASAPWHHMEVRWNYQVHHLPFALEQVIDWKKYLLERGTHETDDARNWMAPRLATDVASIGIVHFSGDVKPWHTVLDAVQGYNQRRAVDHAESAWQNLDVNDFAEYLLGSCCESYNRWFKRQATPEAYAEFGCALLDGGRIEVRQTGSDGSLRVLDITQVVDDAVALTRQITAMAIMEWRGTASRFSLAAPQALLELRSPLPPVAKCFKPGSQVEVLWPAPEVAHDRQPRWLTAMVTSVHGDGRHVVRFHHGGTWGDTERGVVLERIRAVDAADRGAGVGESAPEAPEDVDRKGVPSAAATGTSD